MTIAAQAEGPAIHIHPKLQELARTVQEYFLNERRTSNEIALFLCGGSELAQARLRRCLGRRISSTISKYMYSVYYPEDMFVELILGHQKQDLLSLENLLADSVHCVVILLQSPGTFAELGAFTNHPPLRDKLVVVVDPRHARSPSFISRGPLRYIEKQTKSKVIPSSMRQQELEALTKEVRGAALDIARHSVPVGDLSNPVASYRFYLALVYILDPVPRSLLIRLAEILAGEASGKPTVAAHTVLNTLIAERKVASVAGALSVTDKGVLSLMADNVTKTRSFRTLSFLSHQRLDALNLIMRKKYGRQWAG